MKSPNLKKLLEDLSQRTGRVSLSGQTNLAISIKCFIKSRRISNTYT